jgi:hypothetical protein
MIAKGEGMERLDLDPASDLWETARQLPRHIV